MSKITFHQPRFDKTIKDKVNIKIDTPDPHTIVHSVTARQANLTAIATDGFPSDIDGTHVFVTRIHYMADNDSVKYSPYLLPFIGFSAVSTYDENKPGRLDGYPIHGTSLSLGCGVREPKTWMKEDPYGELGNQNHFPDQNVTKHSKEVISILRIKEFGTKLTVQWIVDGNACREDDCTKEFFGEPNRRIVCDEIFPAVSVCVNNCKIEMIPFDLVNSRSKEVNELKLPFSERLRNFYALHAPYNLKKEYIEKVIIGLGSTQERKDEFIQSLLITFDVKSFGDDNFFYDSNYSSGDRVNNNNGDDDNNDDEPHDSGHGGGISRLRDRIKVERLKNEEIQATPEEESKIEVQAKLVRRLQEQVSDAKKNIRRTEESVNQQKEMVTESQEKLKHAQSQLRSAEKRADEISKSLSEAQSQIRDLLQQLE